MDEQGIIFAPEERKKKYRIIKCSVCGHQWRSYSLGVSPRCPECYRRNFGHAPGVDADKMAEIRSRRGAKAAAPASSETYVAKVNHDGTTEQGRGDSRSSGRSPAGVSLLERLLNLQIGGDKS